MNWKVHLLQIRISYISLNYYFIIIYSYNDNLHFFSHGEEKINWSTLIVFRYHQEHKRTSWYHNKMQPKKIYLGEPKSHLWYGLLIPRRHAHLALFTLLRRLYYVITQLRQIAYICLYNEIWQKNIVRQTNLGPISGKVIGGEEKKRQQIHNWIYLLYLEPQNF